MKAEYTITPVCFPSRSSALETKVRSGEKKVDALAKEKLRVEAELEAMTKKSHDASGQLVHISQELLKKERWGLILPSASALRADCYIKTHYLTVC